MPAQIDTLALSKAIEASGVSPSISTGVTRAMQDIAMKDVPSSSDVREAVHTMTVRIGIMIGASTLALVVAVVGSLISISK